MAAQENRNENVKIVRPVINIREEKENIILDAEMPGLEKDKISVEVHGDELTIVGKREATVPDGYAVLCQERYPVEFRRVFTVGSEVDKGKVKANYENGILRVTLTKSEEAKPKKIAIN